MYNCHIYINSNVGWKKYNFQNCDWINSMLLAKVISLFGKYYFISWVIGIFFALEFRL